MIFYPKKMERKAIEVMLERSKDAVWAYSEGDEFITGVGDTVAECKRSAYECLDMQMELGNIPQGDYRLVFRYDAESFLEHNKGVFAPVRRMERALSTV